MLVLTTQTQDTPVELIPLFSIDGTEYGIARDVDMSAVLRALKRMRSADQMVVMGQLLEDLLGSAAYEALCSYKGLTGAHLKELMDTVSQYAMGQLEDATGN